MEAAMFLMQRWGLMRDARLSDYVAAEVAESMERGGPWQNLLRMD
jgi:hypothetical protein